MERRSVRVLISCITKIIKIPELELCRSEGPENTVVSTKRLPLRSCLQKLCWQDWKKQTDPLLQAGKKIYRQPVIRSSMQQTADLQKKEKRSQLENSLRPDIRYQDWKTKRLIMSASGHIKESEKRFFTVAGVR